MNPELRRNLWLEISAHRLLGTPLVMALVIVALAAMDEGDAMPRISWVALVGFGAVCLLWGTRLATNSIVDEITDRTWDWQRLSTLSPWTMTWGKLFGSTAFAWYAGLLCLLVFLVTHSSQQFESPWRFGAFLVFSAITTHAAGIAVALHVATRGTTHKRRSLGLLVVLLLVLVNAGSILAARNWDRDEFVTWYAIDFEPMNFLLASSIAFAAWAIAGAHRSMCQSLMVRTTPVAWLSFLAFLTVFCAGFVPNTEPDAVSLFTLWATVGLAWGLLLTYVMLFTELTGPMVIRRITWKLRLGQWRRGLEELPCWPVAWIFAAVCAIVVAVNGVSGDGAQWRWLALAPVSLTLLAARDAGILLFCLAAPQPKRATGTALVCIILLSWIVPGLLNASGMPQLAQIVLPAGDGNVAVQILSAALQAIVALVLAWRRIHRSVSGPSQATAREHG